ncbi:hypothetical protein AFK68_27320 [Hydrocoleum sp. CS-953]|uniref:hypothetical protein n=1 Tax=Hydrocoleum sp. CS-953 TaxID=1671698 RepID=UPI000B9B73C2|nr:hypothetical protein [Hydrocoleum sp. CS-953]OZH51978.1 hypothetical protein AFK68_27320 [Hydrocoleum sp. CS-953]
MNQPLKAKQQLKIQRAILQVEDKLVTAIQNALDDTQSYGKLEESQFRNLLEVANTTESTEVIKNFLRYQVGRDEKWGRGKDSLAEKIISYIKSDIKEIAEKIAKTIPDDTETEKPTNYIKLQLIRRYLGYGSRYLVYKRKGQSA